MVSLVLKSVKSILLIDALLYLIGIIGIYLISLKSDLPFVAEYSPAGIIIKDSSGAVDHSLKDLTVSKINEYVPSSPEETETYLDSFKAGDKVKLSLNNKSTIEVTLSKYYSNIYALLTWLIGSSFFVIAIIVLIKAKAQKPARLFHWVSVFTALIIMITWGYYNINPKPLGFFVRGVLHLAVTIVPALFLHFTLVFPREKKLSQKYSLTMLYLLSAVIFVLLNYFLILLQSEVTAESVKSYVFGYNISRIYLILCAVLAIVIFIHSYKTSPSDSDKKKLKWILYGLSVGPLSFILLWTLPIIITSKSLIPEEFVLILISIIPITFSISIVKYHLMDIDYLINRSFVYSIVIGSLLALYMLVIGLLTNFAFPAEAKSSAIISAIIIVILFQPIRYKVQNFVDKKFFRVKYNFREALKRFLDEINETYDLALLAEKIIIKTDELLPVKKIGFFLLNSNNRLKVIAHKNFDLLVNRSVRFQKENLKTELTLPVAVPDSVETAVPIEIADQKVFQRWGMNLVFPLKSSDNQIHGFLVLGQKKSGTKFTVEDIDLLIAVVGRAAASIDRIKLQEELIIERMESERLEELNRLKSYFVSSVSHDMQTPLSSIKMFAEMLQQNDQLQAKKTKEYLEIIEGESTRLSRLIDNVLDFSKIEKGIKQYNFENINLNEIVILTLKLLQYQFRLQKFKVETNLYAGEIAIFADKDAVEEALINLLSNSIKYSKDKKVIRVSTRLKNNFIVLTVEDEGMGIDKKHFEDIYKPFFRIESQDVLRTGGAGLGLSIIKHIMDAHNGVIEVESELGKGSNFKLSFPIIK